MFHAIHETVERTITLPISADEAFPLFTPEGERHWVDDWSPHYFYPANGETLVGMVFATGEGAETTWWTMIDFDHIRHFARYCRVTPGSRTVIVSVQCAVFTPLETAVTVRYELTGLSEAGHTAIQTFVDGYSDMIEGWRTKILRYLAHLKIEIQP